MYWSPYCRCWCYLLQEAHWGRVTHICVSKLSIIGSDNGLLPSRHKAIIWINTGILLIWPLRTSFSKTYPHHHHRHLHHHHHHPHHHHQHHHNHHHHGCRCCLPNIMTMHLLQSKRNICVHSIELWCKRYIHFRYSDIRMKHNDNNGSRSWFMVSLRVYTGTKVTIAFFYNDKISYMHTHETDIQIPRTWCLWDRNGIYFTWYIYPLN